MKLYMQHLRRLFCFLLTILSIFNLTLFPAISTKSQISAAPYYLLLIKLTIETLEQGLKYV